MHSLFQTPTLHGHFTYTTVVFPPFRAENISLSGAFLSGDSFTALTGAITHSSCQTAPTSLNHLPQTLVQT